MTFFDWFDLAMRFLLIFFVCIHIFKFWNLCASVDRIEKKTFPEPEPPDTEYQNRFNLKWWCSKPHNKPKFTKHFP